VHPLQTAVVDYLSQRTEGLMAMWYLTTLWCFIRAAETGARKWQAGAVAACALGMASKETMATAPVAVLLYDRTFLAGSFRAAWAARGKIHLALAATWLLLAALMLGSQVGARGVGFGLGVPWMDYALTQAYSILHYLRLAVLPAPLVFDYGWTFLSPGQALPYVAGCALLAGGILAAMRRRPAAGFAGAWFLLLLAPTSSVIPIVQQPTAESRAYLPLAGLVALAVLGGHRLCRNRLGATLAVAAALAVACGVATHRRNLDYRDEVVLWSDTVAKRPDSARAHGNLSSALLRAGRTGEARAAAATAVRLRPDYPEAHNNLGIVLAQAGDFDAAIEHYRAALRGHPEHAEAQHNLGDALARSGRPAEAISSFEAALRLKPGRVETHNNLGVILLQLGRVEEALVHDRAAIALDPGFADAHYNLGNALAQKGRNEEAAQHFRQALALDPTFAKAANNLGVLHLRAGRFAEASAQFEAALRIKPDYADARRNLERMRPQIIPAP
jgi:Flp pilus assembly protein TadD